MERPEGLRRDRLHCYDLTVPEDFTPRAADGEVESFELWPIERALATVRQTDDFKFNVNLVLIDLFLRERLDRRRGCRPTARRIAGWPGVTWWAVKTDPPTVPPRHAGACRYPRLPLLQRRQVMDTNRKLSPAPDPGAGSAAP